MKKRKLFSKIIFLLLLVLYLTRKNLWPVSIPPQTINFEITKWQSPTKLTKQICKDLNIGKIKCRLWLAKIKGENPQIKPWEYVINLTGSQSTSKVFEQIIDLAVKGPRQTYTKFTILEWWSKFDIAQKLEQISDKEISNAFLTLIDNPIFTQNTLKSFKLFKEFNKPTSLEGFLYPETYFFKPEDITSPLFPALLSKTAVKEFQKNRNELKTQCKKGKNCNPYNLTPYQTIIFASIIEKEERNSDNKPLVADILLRRWKNWWKIEADRTLCYGLQIPSNSCQDYLRNKYLKDSSNPYNTRANKWLPPTPVGNPSKQSIKAVLWPQKNDYWFYLHDKQGQIHFAKTLQQHNTNKAIYIK